MGLPGVVREHPNFRDGPSLESKVIGVLDAGTRLEVLGREGDYFKVTVAGQPGYVHVDFVVPHTGLPGAEALPQAPPQPQPLVSTPSAAPDATGTLEAPAAGRLDAGFVTGRIWNRYGGALQELSAALGIDPGVAVAVLATESGGRALGPDGRMIIRFENHIFYDQWGRSHQETYRQFFAFEPSKRWDGSQHFWRPAADIDWRLCHQSQAGEWEALEFACGLDDTAAKTSISMGLTQIMGFNFAEIGYASVQAMFDAFRTDLRAQIQGFFTYVRGRKGVEPLQRGDYRTFARIYNGAGQEDLYARLIGDGVAEYQRLRAAQG